MVKFLLQRPVAVIMSTIAFIVLGIVAHAGNRYSGDYRTLYLG